jgi:hypothetical protein
MGEMNPCFLWCPGAAGAMSCAVGGLSDGICAFDFTSKTFYTDHTGSVKDICGRLATLEGDVKAIKKPAE